MQGDGDGQHAYGVGSYIADRQARFDLAPNDVAVELTVVPVLLGGGVPVVISLSLRASRLRSRTGMSIRAV